MRTVLAVFYSLILYTGRGAPIKELAGDDEDDDDVTEISMRGYTKKTALASMSIFLGVIALIVAYKVCCKVLSYFRGVKSLTSTSYGFTVFYNMLSGEAFDDDFVENSLVEITRNGRNAGYIEIRR